MAGETSLRTLLCTLAPEPSPGDYVLCTRVDGALSNGTEPLISSHEREGPTLTFKRRQAEHLGLPCEYVAARTTLTVHFSLAAVGLTATFATAPAEAGVSCNVMVDYFHDYPFVARDEGRHAFTVSQRLTAEAY